MPEVEIQWEGGGRQKGSKHFNRNGASPKVGSNASSNFCLKGNPVIFDEVHGVRLNGDSEMAMHGNI